MKTHDIMDLYEVVGQELTDQVLSLFRKDVDYTIHWLTTPRYAFEGRIPYEMCEEDQHDLVEKVVGQLEHGVFL